jgi:hypothetical protein
MSKKKDGLNVDTINRYSPQIQQSFDLNRLESFVTGLGVDFTHYKAIPSPIGQKDRGDYRRSDGVDTITSNGMIYRFSGKFTATMTDNSREQKRTSGGALDPSESRLVMPRFYNKNALADGERIYLMPGDRLYVADPDADVFVANSQKMDYDSDIDNEPMFPICKLEDRIIDSRNIEYTENVDFTITSMGNIRWIAGGRNPGIDSDTGKGRIYSIRYLYRAYYYVVALPKEVRVTNVTTGGIRSPERMPIFASIMREYVFHNQNRGDKLNQNKPLDPQRAAASPTESTNVTPGISVDMSAIGDVKQS